MSKPDGSHRFWWRSITHNWGKNCAGYGERRRIMYRPFPVCSIQRGGSFLESSFRLSSALLEVYLQKEVNNKTPETCKFCPEHSSTDALGRIIIIWKFVASLSMPILTLRIDLYIKAQSSSYYWIPANHSKWQVLRIHTPVQNTPSGLTHTCDLTDCRWQTLI